MMKRTYILAAVCGICLSACMAGGPAFAAETDPFGNKIDWVEDAGGEDNAGEETEMQTEMSSEYSIEEQVEVLQQMESVAAETTTPVETGYLIITMVPPESWSEGSVEVTLWRDGNQKETLWLYRQNGWETRAQVPVGDHTFQRARTASGEEFSPEERSFTITANAAVVCELHEGDPEPEVTVPQDMEVMPSPIETPAEGDTLPVALCVAVAGCLAAGGAGAVGYLLYRRRRKKEYSNDILD